MNRLYILLAGTVLPLILSLSASAQEPKVVSVRSVPIDRASGEAPGYDRIGEALYEVIYAYDLRTAPQGDGPIQADRQEHSIVIRRQSPAPGQAPADTAKSVTDHYTTILQFGAGQARFLDYLTYRVDSLAQAGAPGDQITEAVDNTRKTVWFFEPVVFQNWPEGSLTVDDVLAPGTFTYTEQPRLEWTFGEGEKEVCGYPCQQARTRYGGRDWTVWYTPGIPAAFGPWKLGGLPGLILEAEDAEGLHHFSATAVRRAACPIVRTQDATRDKTQRDRFVQRKNASGGSSLSNIPPESIRSIAVFKTNDGDGVISVNGVPIRLSSHVYVPLELE